MLINYGFEIKGVLEPNEPDFELNGQILKMENLIEIATKSGF